MDSGGMSMNIQGRDEAESGRLGATQESQLMAEIVDGSELAFHD